MFIPAWKPMTVDEILCCAWGIYVIENVGICSD